MPDGRALPPGEETRSLRARTILLPLGSAAVAGVLAWTAVYALGWILTPVLRNGLIVLVALAAFFAAVFLLRIAGLKERANLLELRLEDAARSLERLRHEADTLRDATLQVVENAGKLSLINRVESEVLLADTEENLFDRVLRVLLDGLGIERGVVLRFEEDLSFAGPALVRLRGGLESMGRLTVGSSEYSKTYFRAVFLDREPRIVPKGLPVEGMDGGEKLVVPVVIRNQPHGCMVLDNPVSKRSIKEKNLHVFSSVANQVALGLDNIIAAAAARRIVSYLPLSILVFDRHSCTVSFVSATYLAGSGREPAEVEGLNALSVLEITESQRAFFLASVEDVEKTGLVEDVNFRTASNRLLHCSFFRLPEFGHRLDIGVVVRDVTKQTELQDQLFRAEKMAALGTLASGIAHEVNNPLYGVLGTAEIIRDEAESETIRSYAADIIDYTTQASDIVKDLSSYTRSLREESPARVDVNAVIESALRMAGYGPYYIDIAVLKDLAPVPPIWALEGEIREIFLNLFNNAVQAMGGKGTIRVETRVQDGFLHCSVEDNGPGMPDEIRRRVFDPFFTTKPVGEGTGLGLHIVYRLVTKYGGFVSVESDPGLGARFSVRFPTVEYHGEDPGR